LPSVFSSTWSCSATFTFPTTFSAIFEMFKLTIFALL
jgi:hypothetical protein